MIADRTAIDAAINESFFDWMFFSFAIGLTLGILITAKIYKRRIVAEAKKLLDAAWPAFAAEMQSKMQEKLAPLAGMLDVITNPIVRLGASVEKFQANVFGRMKDFGRTVENFPLTKKSIIEGMAAYKLRLRQTQESVGRFFERLRNDDAVDTSSWYFDEEQRALLEQIESRAELDEEFLVQIAFSPALVMLLDQLLDKLGDEYRADIDALRCSWIEALREMMGILTELSMGSQAIIEVVNTAQFFSEELQTNLQDVLATLADVKSAADAISKPAAAQESAASEATPA